MKIQKYIILLMSIFEEKHGIQHKHRRQKRKDTGIVIG
jgi:hypothetical protein